MSFNLGFLAILVLSVPSNGVPLRPSLDTLTSLVASPSNGCPDNSCQVNPIPCCQPCPVEEKKPCPVEPQCQECPVDLSQSTNRGLGKAWQVILQGKALESTLAQSLASPFVLKYDALAAAASSLPGVLAAKGELLGKIFAVPFKTTAFVSSSLAKGLAHAVVGLPVAVGTGIAATASGLYSAIINDEEDDSFPSSSDFLSEDYPNDPATEAVIPGAELIDDLSRKDSITITSTTSTPGTIHFDLDTTTPAWILVPPQTTIESIDS